MNANTIVSDLSVLNFSIPQKCTVEVPYAL